MDKRIDKRFDKIEFALLRQGEKFDSALQRQGEKIECFSQKFLSWKMFGFVS